MLSVFFSWAWTLWHFKTIACSGLTKFSITLKLSQSFILWSVQGVIIQIPWMLASTTAHGCCFFIPFTKTVCSGDESPNFSEFLFPISMRSSFLRPYFMYFSSRFSRAEINAAVFSFFSEPEILISQKSSPDSMTVPINSSLSPSVKFIWTEIFSFCRKSCFCSIVSVQISEVNLERKLIMSAPSFLMAIDDTLSHSRISLVIFIFFCLRFS